MQRLVVAALLLVLVGGCSSDPEPKEPKPSAKPTITAPTMPAQAKENTDEGAAAFVDHYVQVLNYAAATGDVDELSRLSSPDCQGCQSYIKLYRETYKVGGYIKGGEWKLGELRLRVTDLGTSATTTVATAATRYRENTNSPEQSGAAESNKISFGLTDPASTRKITQLALGEAE